MQKTIVIYHRADFDGIFCREIAKKFLPEAELVGWDFGDAPVKLESLTDCKVKIYVLDLPIDRVFGFDYALSPTQPFVNPDVFVWIDHHKSAIESHPSSIPGYRIDGVAACRLVWQWFVYTALPDHDGHDLPSKADFIERKVLEPLAVRLAGEYDIWDKRDPRAELFQHGLRSRELSNDWGIMLSVNRTCSVTELEGMIDAGYRDCMNPDGTVDNPIVVGLLEAGRGIQYAKTHENESIIKSAGFTIKFEGLTFLACNHARFNSHLFTAGLNPEHDACFGFCWDGQQWKVSLYHAPGKEQHDLSQIAVKHGGGGHRGACGFMVKTLPFLT